MYQTLNARAFNQKTLSPAERNLRHADLVFNFQMDKGYLDWFSLAKKKKKERCELALLNTLAGREGVASPVPPLDRPRTTNFLFRRSYNQRHNRFRPELTQDTTQNQCNLQQEEKLMIT